MDFSWSREEDEFRQEIRDFLKAELPQGWNDTLVLDKESEEYIELAKDFTQRVGAKGWLAAHWPQEYGGLGWSFWQYFIMNEEMVTSDAPLIGMNGPKFLVPPLSTTVPTSRKNAICQALPKARPCGCRAMSRTPVPTWRPYRRGRLRMAMMWVINARRSGRATSTIPTGASLARTDPDAPNIAGFPTFWWI